MAICLVFTAGIEFVNSFLHGGNQIDTMTLLIEIIGLISCALFSGLSVGTQRQDNHSYRHFREKPELRMGQ